MRLLLLLFVFLFLLHRPVRAQQHVAQARQQSYLTKVFRLTENQTRHLYEHGLQAARPEFFTQLVDSFPTAKPRPRPLGYYLQAHAEGPRLVYELRSETDREVLVIDNQVDLTLAVRDSLGQLLAGAQVALAGRPLPFDASTQTFRRAGGGRTGLVAVTQGGHTTFHPLNQVFPVKNRPRGYRPQGYWLRRAGGRVLYGFPVGCLARPVRTLVQDLHHPSNVSTGLIGLLRSPFDEDVRDDRRERRGGSSDGGGPWTNYVATSQPSYRPTGDTLRLKARVLHRKNGRPYRRPLALWLGGGYGSPSGKRIATLRPTRPGSYHCALPLTDSLGLRPDTHVGFRLQDKHGNVLASGQFRLEDYELKNSRYTLRVAEKTQLSGQPQAVFVRGTDANDLNLLDARLRLSLTPVGAPGRLAARPAPGPTRRGCASG